jgi:uncharacterized membrane protein YccC
MRLSPLIDTLRARDPGWVGLHRAIRAAVVIPALFAFSEEVIGNVGLATFAAFGGFALLLFVDFPGARETRLTSYSMLAVTGAVFISVGTLASRPTALAVASMAVVAFGVLFAGTLSASIAAAGRSALLLYILPVSLPGNAAAITPRLEGWGLAVAVGIPAAMLIWPPTEHDNLRHFAAGTCDALAAVITARDAGQGEPGDDLCQTLTGALTNLRQAYRGTTSRPVGITTGSRLLIRLIEDLEWLGSVTASLHAEQIGTWTDVVRQAMLADADVLRASAAVLRTNRRTAAPDEGRLLNEAIVRLAERRQRIASQARLLLTSPGSEKARDAVSNLATTWPYEAHQVSYATSLIGITVQWAAEADSRPLLAQVLGRHIPGPDRAPLSPALEIATSQIERHSVWLQNAIRGALGLGLAVLFARLTGTQHAFWVVLGALSVLRSNALSTGSTAVRAMAGTVAGFIIGAVIVLGLGHDTTVLWFLLPVAVLAAAITPQVISFAAGQAGFTVLLLILFNIIAPTGWKVGLVRIEDIGLGCVASLIVGILAWPHGALASIGTALSNAYRVGAAYLDAVVLHTLGEGPEPSAQGRAVLAAGRRQDDALRQYLAERGATNVPVADLTAAANGATRLRLAGEAIAALQPSRAQTPAVRFPAAAALVHDQVASVCRFYDSVADRLDPHLTSELVTTAVPAPNRETVLDTLRRELGGDFDHPDEVDEAKHLLWTAIYIEDLRILGVRLSERLESPETLTTPRRAPEPAPTTAPSEGWGALAGYLRVATARSARLLR